MNSPPAARPRKYTRLRAAGSADGTPLPERQYAWRREDGSLVRLVSRDRAEGGIRAGIFGLWFGPHGAFLRSAPRRADDVRDAPVLASWPMLPWAPKGARAPKISNFTGGLGGHPHPASGLVGAERRIRVGPTRG
jgi:hypothetical protein